jgi:hypothetical protein
VSWLGTASPTNKPRVRGLYSRAKPLDSNTKKRPSVSAPRTGCYEELRDYCKAEFYIYACLEAVLDEQRILERLVSEWNYRLGIRKLGLARCCTYHRANTISQKTS